MKKTIGELGTNECRVCKERFTPKNSSNKGHYCSKRCYGQAVKGIPKSVVTGLKISAAKRAKIVYTTKHCLVCGKEMLLTPFWTTRRKTCSRECMGKAVTSRLNKMWKNPPQTLIDKIRAGAIRRRKQGRLEKETKPEKLFREELERRGIVHQAQFAFGGMMVVDFFIPYLQAFVFCDGSYWHGLPSSIEKDEQQVMFARAKGLKVYRFKDTDIYANVTRCVDEVLEDAAQPFSIAEVIDKLTILTIKNGQVSADKAEQHMRDYRRMERVALAGMDYLNISKPTDAVAAIRDLAKTNVEIFYEVEKVERNEQTPKDATNLQTLIKKRSQLKNKINQLFGEDRWEVKVYKGKSYV